MSFIFIVFLSISTFAQKTTFTNSVDQDLTIKSVVASPMVDNLNGVYAKALTEHLDFLLGQEKQWTKNTFPEDLKYTPENYEDKPDLVKAVLKKTGSDAFITSRLSKGPNGISLRMNLYAGKEGLLLAQQILPDFSGFELTDLKQKLYEQLQNLIQKIPYDGFVLSRKGLLVTINIGAKQGIQENSEVAVVQIIKTQRHPKFNFLVNTEKEILGKVKVKKVEEFLSFATITKERDEGVIQTGQKLLVDKYVKYPEAPLTAEGKLAEGIGTRSDNPVAFGNNPSEWMPQAQPTYGKVGLLIGLGTYTISNNLSSAGGIAGTNSLIPSIHGTAEMWINPEWFMSFSLRQFIFSVTNPYPNSTPSRLNISTSQYSLQAGYNFLLEEQFFGPKIQLTAGYSKFSSFVDQSTPVAFTSQTYSGFLFGLGGAFPLKTEEKIPLTLGARLNFFWNPAFDETPVTSGSASNSINSFSAFGEYRYSNRLNLKLVLDYDLFSTNFSGRGTRTESASSSSHTMTTVSTGLEYMF